MDCVEKQCTCQFSMFKIHSFCVDTVKFCIKMCLLHLCSVKEYI